MRQKTKTLALSMWRKHCLIALIAILGLTTIACSVPEYSQLIKQNQPSKESAYMAGVFTGDIKTMSDWYAFQIENIQTNETFVLPFFDDSKPLGSQENHASIIALKPGTYRIKGWFTYSTFEGLGEKVSHREFPPNLSNMFFLSPGKISYIGYFETSNREEGHAGYKVVYWDIIPKSLELNTAKHLINEQYPNFNLDMF